MILVDENPILHAAEHHRAGVFFLRPTGMQTLPTSYEPSSHARLLFISDVAGGPDGKSLGVAAYSDELLRVQLRKARMVVMSAVPEAAHEMFVATMMLAARDPWFGVVMTSPNHHVAWANKVVELTGDAPVLHIADDETDLTGIETPIADIRFGREVLH